MITLLVFVFTFDLRQFPVCRKAKEKQKQNKNLYKREKNYFMVIESEFSVSEIDT